MDRRGNSETLEYIANRDRGHAFALYATVLFVVSLNSLAPFLPRHLQKVSNEFKETTNVKLSETGGIACPFAQMNGQLS